MNGPYGLPAGDGHDGEVDMPKSLVIDRMARAFNVLPAKALLRRIDTAGAGVFIINVAFPFDHAQPVDIDSGDADVFMPASEDINHAVCKFKRPPISDIADEHIPWQDRYALCDPDAALAAMWELPAGHRQEILKRHLVKRNLDIGSLVDVRK